MSVSIAPPTTTSASPKATLPFPPNTPDLFEELERRGYDLTVRRRATPDMHERRRRIAAERRLKGQFQGISGMNDPTETDRLDRSSCIWTVSEV